MITLQNVALTQSPPGAVEVETLRQVEYTDQTPLEEVLLPAEARGPDSVGGGPAGPPLFPLDEPFFPGLLLNDQGEAGFALGEMSLSDSMGEGTDTPGEAGENDLSLPEVNPGNVEDFSADVPNQLPSNEPKLLALPPGTIIRRTSMNQALSTGDTILGNLGSLRGFLASPFMPADRHERPALRSGMIEYWPHAGVGVVVDHFRGVGNSGGKGQVRGFSQAGIEARIQEGRRISGVLDYTIGISSPTGRSGGAEGEGGDDLEVEQELNLELGFSFPKLPKWRFGFELDYTQLSGVDRDIGASVTRALGTGTFMATYVYSRKTRLDWDVSVPIREYNGGIGSAGVTTTFFLNNQITRKTQVGLGISTGTLKVEGGSDQWFQQILMRANYDPAGAWSFDTARSDDERNSLARFYVPSSLWTFGVTAGLELRESGGSPDVNPIFGLGVNWKPNPGTIVLLAGESRVFNSASVLNTNYRSTSVSLTVKQRIGYRLAASLSISYENAAYEAGHAEGQKRRTDNLIEASIGFHMPITRRWSWDLILSAGKNESNVAPLEFYQGVLQTSYQF